MAYSELPEALSYVLLLLLLDPEGVSGLVAGVYYLLSLR